MSDIAVRVEGLCKRYRIGRRRRRHRSLRDAVERLATAPLRQLAAAARGRSAPAAKPTIWALQDVSFDVRRGEAIGIIGRNGAGKSTLLKVLSRITEPTSGYAAIHGRIGSLLEVGTGFHPELTGRENIFLNGAILGMKRAEIERKFDEIVAFAAVEDFLDTPVKRYSSGMYVRLAFAVAAHLEPEILVVDEVLAVGDAEFQKKCLGKMKDVSEGGRTVLFVSHNMGAISNLCSRIVWLDAGRVAMDGETRDVVSRYVLSQSDKGGEASWTDPATAPGNDQVRLRAVRVRSDDVTGANVLIDRPVVIEMEYWNLKEGQTLLSTVHLRDNLGTLVLVSSNRPSATLGADDWFARPRPRGLFRTACVVPANFLNDGYYCVDVTVENGRNERQLHHEGVVSFLVHETGEMRREYSGAWGGVVRPKLAWCTDYLGESLSSGVER